MISLMPRADVFLAAANAFTAAQTITAAGGLTTQAAATQDAIQVKGRAGGTGTYVATLTPLTLSASRTISLPDAAGTVALLGAQTFTAAQTIDVASGTIQTWKIATAVKMILDGNGQLGLGATAPTNGNGLLQLTSGTTIANGIAFGTDTFLYRNATGALKTDGNLTVAGTTNVVAINSTGQSSFALAAGSTLATFSIGTPSTAQQCGIAFADQSTAKWNLYKNTDNSLNLFNQTINVFTFTHATGDVSFGAKIATTSTADGAITTAGKITAKAAVPGSFADVAAVQTYLASILT